jgi:hypothetical protein
MKSDTQHPSFPYVFVVGCPRSGTTLLQRMLDAHPMLTVSNDTHFIPRALDKVKTDTNLSLTPELVDFVRHYKRFRRLGISDAAVDLAAQQSSTYPEFVSALYAARAQASGKLLAGEKTPDYVRRIPVLHRLFPSARFIHIIRDGRDVALSTLQWAHEKKGPGRYALWQDYPLAVCALWWAWQVNSGREEGAALGAGVYLEVRYEDLVANPEENMARITHFLNLPYAQEMVAFHAGKTRKAEGLSAKSAWLPVTGGLRAWDVEMAPEDQALFQTLAGNLLDALEYEKANVAANPGIMTTANHCREWWNTEKMC